MLVIKLANEMDRITDSQACGLKAIFLDGMVCFLITTYIKCFIGTRLSVKSCISIVSCFHSISLM